MFLESFKITAQAIFQLILLAGVGFFFVRRRLILKEGLACLNDLVVVLFLPLFMFSEITQRFSFALYPDWWLFPILSFLITAVGYFCGLLAVAADKSLEKVKGEFLGVASFQNSGYLMLPLAASLLPLEAAQEMFILIFLFLLGFNMTIFSLGVVLLAPKQERRRFDFKEMFNAPVLATLLALIFVFLKWHRGLPEAVMKPAGMLGRCAIPLSIFVVGGNLASMKETRPSYAKPLAYALGIKLVVLPLVFLGFVVLLKLRPLVGLLLVLQASMPPAVLLSVLAKNKNGSDRLISPAIFFGHLVGILTIPLFLALYWALAGKLF